ncbi:MepB family protein [Leptospira ilyithenensis]|uniref:MepB protein n=1 Tax=Leptospira ilyithenensis TaxID=2484901 RepID=A0A4R9LPE8_9LEPT|nr:MepB family protein [Leptospira ilyithenensis]TGN09689.1 mepB protein [Leptospira ilyithenensis]
MNHLNDIKENVFDHCGIQLLNPSMEKESSEYGACHFEIDDLKITFRIAKITPTKIGQFVTLWKRKDNGPIKPFNIKDNIDYFIIRANNKNLSGQFIFPKHVLYEKGIISGKKEGKLGFRIYPSWDIPTNKQAQMTQKWQLEYFLESSKNKPIDTTRAKFLLNYKK